MKQMEHQVSSSELQKEILLFLKCFRNSNLIFDLISGLRLLTHLTFPGSTFALPLSSYFKPNFLSISFHKYKDSIFPSSRSLWGLGINLSMLYTFTTLKCTYFNQQKHLISHSLTHFLLLNTSKLTTIINKYLNSPHTCLSSFWCSSGRPHN